MGLFAWLLKNGAKLLVIIGSALVTSLVFGSLILGLNPLMHQGLRALGLLSSIVCVGGGVALGLYGDNWNILNKYAGPGAVVSNIVILAVSIPMSIVTIIQPAMPTNLALSFGIISVFAIAMVIFQKKTHKLKGQGSASIKPASIKKVKQQIGISSDIVGGLEVIEIPYDYLSDRSQEAQREHLSRYRSILRGMRFPAVPIGLRFERVANKNRVYFTTWSSNPQKLRCSLDTLQSTLKRNLPNFKFHRHDKLPNLSLPHNAIAITVNLKGAPLAALDSRQQTFGLEGAIELLQYEENGLIQLFVTPANPSYLRRAILKRQCEGRYEKSKTTYITPKSGIIGANGQEQSTHVDIGASSDVTDISNELRRHEVTDAVNVVVSITCWQCDSSLAELTARRIAEAIASRIIPASIKDDFKLNTISKSSKNMFLLRGLSIGSTTRLTIEEALSFFSIPQKDLGISVVEHAPFHMNPAALKPVTDMSANQNEDVIAIGHILDERENTVCNLELPVKSLTQHMGIYGETGSGKTTTSIKILHELHKKGINFLVILPGKNELYRTLISRISGMKVFTPGDETTAKMRYNPHRGMRGVLVNSIISDTKTAFVAAMPSYGMIKEYMEAAIDLTYERHGWKRAENICGHPILPSDLLDSIPLIEERELDYSERGNQDFRGALRGRFSSMKKGPLSQVYNTLTGISNEEFVSAPSLILLEGLSNEEQALFMADLLIDIAHYFEVQKKEEASPIDSGLKFVVVLEEAHRLLANRQGSICVDEGHASRTHGIESLTRIMREARSSGLGFMIITQLPGDLDPAAIKLAVTNIIHCIGPIGDRALIGQQVNCTEDQITRIGSLACGQAVVRISGRSRPLLGQIIPTSLPTVTFTNERIRKHMEAVYEKNPHFREGIESANLPAHKTHQLDPRVISEMLHIIQHYAFSRTYSAAISAAKKGDSVIGAWYYIKFVEKVMGVNANVASYCKYLHWYLTQNQPDESFIQASDVILEQALVFLKTENCSDKEKTDIQRYWTTITAEAEGYLRIRRDLDDDGRQDFILHFVREAVQARDEGQKSAVDEPEPIEEQVSSANKSSALDPVVSEEIRNFVATNQFEKTYLKDIELAENGNVFSLVNTMKRLAGRVTSENQECRDIAQQMALQARDMYKVPVNEDLFSQILSTIKGEMTS